MKSVKSAKDFQNDYKLDEMIGKGSFGRVHKAIELKSGKIVAIKIVDMEDCESEIEEIFQEIAFLGTCSSQYITEYIASCAIGQNLWIVMEYLGGGSVLDLLKMGPLEERYCQIIARDLLRGLNYLHLHGKIHRDIKCANILLSDYGNVKIADFGVAGQLTKTVNKRSTFVGTPFWMAPEVIKQSDYGTGVDIWSTGIVCVEMCDGQPPYFSDHPMKALMLITSEEPPVPKNKKISSQFLSFISLCLTKDPDIRPDAQTLLENSFVRKAKKNHYLQPLIQKYKQFCKVNARDESLDEDNSGEEDGENHQGGELKWLFETIRIVDREDVRKMMNNARMANEENKKLPTSDVNHDPIIKCIENLSITSENSNPLSEMLVNILNQLSFKHKKCDTQIQQLIHLAGENDFSLLLGELTQSIKRYTTPTS